VPAARSSALAVARDALASRPELAAAVLPTVHRLRTRTDFSRVMRSRTRSSVGCLVIHLHSAGDAQPRMGLVIAKTVGGSVTRHLVARRLRAVVAGRIASWPMGTDVVIRALPEAASADVTRLAHDLDRALERLGVTGA